MWKILLLRFDGLVISLASIGYGVTLIANPQMLGDYKTYAVIGGLFQTPVLAYAFVFFGIIKLLGVIFNNKRLKVTGIFGLFFLWITFSISFFIVLYAYGFATSMGWVCSIPALISGKIALSEV